MKIVHISTSDTGGASIAALRIHAGLIEEGVDSSFLSLYKSNNNYPLKYKFDSAPVRNTLTNRLKVKLGLPLTQAERNRRLLRRYRGEYEIFTFPHTDHKVEDHPLVGAADIVHLHWVADFINYPTFFSGIKKPIVWTFHDMNPMLGGFHYDCDRLRNPKMHPLDDELAGQKAKALSPFHSLVLAAPSTWMISNIKQSRLFKDYRSVHIPYGLDTSVFKPHDKLLSRNVFDLPHDKTIILFVCENINNHRKGLDLLIEALNLVHSSDNFALVAVGQGDLSSHTSAEIIMPGKIEDERLMSLLYSAADLFVLPSRQDNFPNVILESMACGTPVLSFKEGGMCDAIQHGKNGLLVGNKSPDLLKEALQKIIDREITFNREAIRTFTVQHYDLTNQANRYIALYREIQEGSTKKKSQE